MVGEIAGIETLRVEIITLTQNLGSALWFGTNMV